MHYFGAVQQTTAAKIPVIFVKIEKKKNTQAKG